MATLELKDLGEVEVGDEFLNLSPAEQQKTVDEIEHALRVNKRAEMTAGGAAETIARSFGASDELAGLAAATRPFAKRLAGGDMSALNVFNPFKDAGGDITSTYETARDLEKQRVEKYRQDNPPGAIKIGDKVYAAPGASGYVGEELLGGLVTGGPAKAAATGGGKMFSALPQWAQASTLGGMWGAGTGALSADPGERAKGAAIGGTVGATVPLAITGARAGKNLASATVGGYFRARTNPEEQALRVMRTNLGYDDVSVDEAVRRLREMGPQATFSDVADENVMGLARGAAGVPGEAKRRILDTFKTRAKGEAGRIAPHVTKNLGPGDYLASEEALLGKLGKNATGVYTPAYQKNPAIPTSNNLANFLKQPEARIGIAEAASIVRHKRLRGENVFLGPIDDELTEAARFARELGKMQQPIPKEGIAKNFSLETWDHIKQGLDTLLASEKYTNKFTGKLNRQGVQLAKTKDWLVGMLDGATGGEKSLYAKARAQYSGDAEMVSALREGAKVGNKSVEMIKRELADLSDAAKDAYRNGAARHYMEKTLERVPDTASIATRLENTPMARDKLRALFPTETDYNAFKKVLDAEMRFAETRNFIGAGSRTAPMGEDIKNLRNVAGSVGALLGSELPFGHALVASTTGRRIMQALVGDNTAAFNNEISKMLTTMNPAEQQAIIDGLRRVGTSPWGQQLSPQMRNAMMLGATAVGQQTGRSQ